MKVALVHDALCVYGGAEKVLEELHHAFPEAPIFVPIYRKEAFPEALRQWNVIPSWMNRIPQIHRFYRSAFPLYPFAMAAIDLDDFDVVISSSFNFAHNIVTGPDTRHICYCHSPARFLWDANAYAEHENLRGLSRALYIAALPHFRALDRAAGQGVDEWISTSGLVRDRIRKIYHRRSTIVPPPVDTNAFPLSAAKGEYFLLVMRLVGWKRVDIVIEACNRLQLPLVIAGRGRDEERLKSLAGPTVRFAGWVDGRQKAELYAHARALIVPSIEDFGITMLEAMSCGKPVIAVGKGGALDTVVEGMTGMFFAEQTTDCLAETLARFQPDDYDMNLIRSRAELFDSRAFRARMRHLVYGRQDAPEVEAPVLRAAE